MPGTIVPRETVGSEQNTTDRGVGARPLRGCFSFARPGATWAIGRTLERGRASTLVGRTANVVK
jgi:hypothetical protein